jgi:NADH dehydrogenase (ubiquinone) 1 alpha subcomplex subunit 5
MKVVDEHRSIRAIEEKISCGLIEELIVQAHNEIKLLRIMKQWRPWEFLPKAEDDPAFT